MSAQIQQGFSAKINGKNKNSSAQNSSFQTKGALIMQIADALKPGLQKMLEGVRNEEGMHVQPARVRGVALNMAQAMVNAKMASSQ